MPKKFSEVEITSDHHQKRLDKVLSDVSEFDSRSQCEKLITDGFVSINGDVVTKTGTKLQEGDILKWTSPEPQSTDLFAWDTPLDIRFEDSDVIVINKPAPMVVHPSAGHENDTLVNALLHHTQDLSMGSHEMRPGIVHRLDKDTSGLLVVAKNNFAHTSLSQQFQDRTIHRIYHALVWGHLAKDEGRIESELIRHPNHRKRFASKKANDQRSIGKTAITNYKVLCRLQSPLSLVRVQLETGRTHQIRVHLSELGHPVFSDPIYAPTKPHWKASGDLQEKHRTMNRIALHARELGFQHPRSGEALMFESDWPAEMDFIKELPGFHND